MPGDPIADLTSLAWKSLEEMSSCPSTRLFAADILRWTVTTGPEDDAPAFTKVGVLAASLGLVIPRPCAGTVLDFCASPEDALDLCPLFSTLGCVWLKGDSVSARDFLAADRGVMFPRNGVVVCSGFAGDFVRTNGCFTVASGDGEGEPAIRGVRGLFTLRKV